MAIITPLLIITPWLLYITVAIIISWLLCYVDIITVAIMVLWDGRLLSFSPQTSKSKYPRHKYML